MKHTLFISDLHLCHNQQHLLELFAYFLKNYAEKAEALYILGDLFEVWIGDDALEEWSSNVAKLIHALVQQGVPVYLMPGNRDFLLGQQFAKLAGCKLLKDPTLIEIYGNKLLLKHGDDLCSLDRRHQWFRKLSQSWLVKSIYLNLPLTWRQKIANKVRQVSSNANAKKYQEIMDVVPQMYQGQLLASQADLLVHGHTHQPAIHYFYTQNRFWGHLVLGDWGQSGSFARLMANGKWFLESFSK